MGAPLALPAFLSGVDDAYLARSIRIGRPGRVMPAFPQLSERQVSAVVGHLRSWSSGKSPNLPQHRISGDKVKGQKLYKQHCAACHGEHGEGGHGTGVTVSRPRSAPVLAPALNNPGFLASASDTLIKTALLQGRDGTPMQSFLQQGLNKGDINGIVSFVRNFETQSTATGARILDVESPILVRESPYNLERTVEKVKAAVGAANLRLIRVQTLDQGLVKEGQENPDQTIVYSCDFDFLNEALKVDPRVGLFLPCRITVVRHAGKVLVMSINPKRLSRIFNDSELNELCEKLYQVYLDILEEVVL